MAKSPTHGHWMFPPTQWSLVAYVARCRNEDPVALGELLSRYLPALKAHLVLKKGIDAEYAEDVLQGFVADKVIQRNLLAAATRRKGKFRTFLLTALDRYAWNRLRDENAKKRRPRELLSLDADGAKELVISAERTSDPFDEIWAKDVIAEALRLTEAECSHSGRSDVWGVFQSRILSPLFDGTEPVPYERIIEKFGFKSPIQASNVLTTAKRMFARNMRSVIAEYVTGAAEIEEEIADLRDILSHSGA